VTGFRHLFVTGSPHESVFETGMLLNEHPHVLLGIQRYANISRLVDRFQLAPERLVTPLSVDTDIRGQLLYSRLRHRIETGQLAITGDVDPAHAHTLPLIGRRLGGPSVVVVLGAPPQPEFETWRTTVRLVRDTERQWFAGRVFMLPYGAFLAGDEPWLEALLAFLRLAPTDRLDDCYARIRAAAAPDQNESPPGPDHPQLLAWLRHRAQTELKRHGGVRPGIMRLHDPVLLADELAARARERHELLAQRRAGSSWPDERQAFAARYRQQAQEIVGLGAGITRLGRTAAHGLPSPEFRVGLISPQPTADQIGRTQAIAALAGHLAPLCAVRLIATQLPSAQPAGVDIQIRSTLTAALWEDCDVVLYPGDMPGGALLAGGRAIMLLDGFERPSDEAVRANLGRAREVFAASSWLCELARDHGATAIHLPPGLDRILFEPGPPQEERGLHVTGVAQVPAHLGCFELSEAMVLVRERRPEVKVTLVGGVPADGATKFLLHPPLDKVAQILASSAIHVTSAREEGFGFLGAAALARGAALVTTDNRGSRDYAVHDRTALVSPVGDAQALADHVLALLDDPSRRARLVAEGSQQVRLLLPSWPEYARALALLLTEPG
jgi:hypothetical protein